METTQRGAEQHCKPQMELSQEGRQQTSLPEFLKKRAQLHRVKDVRTQTRAVLQNSATAGFYPCMTECLTLRELEEALKKMKQKKAPGLDGITNEMLKHLGPGAKRTYPTAHLQPKLVDRYCTNNLEGSCHKTHSKKGKRQAGSFQLPPDQSAQLCWKASGEDHQQKAHMASWVKLSSGFNTNRLSTIRKHRRPTGSLDAGHRRCLPREEEGSGSLSLACQRPSTKFGKRGYC